jgi:hypothetical protein
MSRLKSLFLVCYCTFLWQFALPTELFALGQIKGTVRNTGGEPLPFAIVALMRADSSQAGMDQAAADGTFQFGNLPIGSYYLQASAIGYSSGTSDLLVLTLQEPILERVMLSLSIQPTQLAEVRVQAGRPFLEQNGEKTIINVASSISSTGSTALEVLERAPGVEIDRQNNTITVRGKAGVRVMINGKSMQLSLEDLMVMLQTMPSTTIDRIELTPNPSAREEAAGNAGLLNIVLKKSLGVGLNGSVLIGAGYGETLKHSASLSLNYRTEKVNLFGSADWSYNPIHIRALFGRTIQENPSPIFLDTRNDWYSRNISAPLRLGFDWFINKRTIVGSQLMVTHTGSNQQSNNRTDFIGERLDSLLRLNAYNRQGSWQGMANMNVKHTFDSSAARPKELNLDLDLTLYNRYNQATYQGYYALADGQVLRPLSYRGNVPARITIGSFRLDYTHQINPFITIESGYRGALVQTHSDVRFDELNASGLLVAKPELNQLFTYRERVHAGYVVAKRTSSGWDWQLGLRVEQTRTVAHLPRADTRVERSYLDWFPSVSLTQKLSLERQIHYSYSRRIDRPNYQNLNPNLSFITPLLYFQGNSLLTPQYTHSFLVNYSFKSLSLGLNYSLTRQAMQWVTEQNDLTRVQRATFMNISSLKNLNLTASLPIKLISWWNTSNAATLYQNRVEFMHLGSQFRNQRISVTLRSTQTFTLPHDWQIELSALYNSPQAAGFLTILHQKQINISVQKRFWQNKATFRLALNDVFYWNDYKNQIRYQNLYINNFARRETRQLRMSVSYRFGNSSVKESRKRTTGTVEEQNRL